MENQDIEIIRTRLLRTPSLLLDTNAGFENFQVYFKNLKYLNPPYRHMPFSHIANSALH